ncbi:MAG: hypothetical protein J5J00_09105 [Deltaproteobacteria bacterium]|nr:hypothetical protein [Deltaproteobacteria bacterium]
MLYRITAAIVLTFAPASLCAEDKPFANSKAFSAFNLISELFSAKSSDAERYSAAKLVEKLRAQGTSFSVHFKEINESTSLSNELYLTKPKAIVVIAIGQEVYLWNPIDRENTDMFFTE